MTKIIKISQPIITKDEENAALKVLRSGMFVQGENVRNFEEKFAKHVGSKYAVAVSNGTAALHVSALALGIKTPNEVITPTFSFISTANCALYCGAKPIFADIELNSYNLDPNSVKQELTKNTKAIIPVHIYGHPALMDELMEIASKNDLNVIEDCAQAIGAEFSKRKVGTIGDLGCFSFYPTKEMTTIEGGMVVTNNEEFAEKVKLLRNIGQKDRYIHTDIGYNYRMNELEAAIGLEQLKKVNEWIKIRIDNAKLLTQNLDGIKGIVTPSTNPKVKHVFNLYTVRITNECKLTRQELQKKLLSKGIETGVYYPIPIHEQPFYKSLGYNGSYLNTEKASEEVLSLPIHPKVSKGDIKLIADTIHSILS